jgi:FKBP-type peptidyl-prolyl cis-trans isomerase
MTKWIAVALLSAGLSLPAVAEEARALPGGPVARESYSVGYAFGDGLKQQGVEVQEEILIQAIRDGLAGRTPLLSAEELRTTLLELRQKGMALADRRAREGAAKGLAEGQAFLETHKAQPGVKVLASGLQYQVLRTGDGHRPTASDTVRVQYRGTLIDGTEFDNSEKRPAPALLRVDGVIKGWCEALQLMNVGAKWRLVVPPDLAYGQHSLGHIPANSTLVFDVELLAIEKQADGAAPSQTR